MRQLLYSSECARPPIGDELATILIQSRRNNRIRSITGLLWTDGFRFAQVLEGGWDAVQGRFDIIRADVRHKAVLVLADVDVEARTFDAWSMALMDDDDYRLSEALKQSNPRLRTIFAELTHTSADAVRSRSLTGPAPAWRGPVDALGERRGGRSE